MPDSLDSRPLLDHLLQAAHGINLVTCGVLTQAVLAQLFRRTAVFLRRCSSSPTVFQTAVSLSTLAVAPTPRLHA
jgi:hypothetical protein